MLNVNGYFDPLLAMLDRAEEQGFIFPEHRSALLCAVEPDSLLEAMEGYQPSDEPVERWMRRK